VPALRRSLENVAKTLLFEPVLWYDFAPDPKLE
jgi:hypothetical protein